MKEEDVSTALYLAACVDPNIQVLSWQAVDGKSYFTTDVKLRLTNGERVEPDLVVLVRTRVVWLIEVKGNHRNAIGDEKKLVQLLDSLGANEILRQVGLRSGVDIEGVSLRLAIAFWDLQYELTEICEASVAHLNLLDLGDDTVSTSLSSVLSGWQ